LLTRIKLASLAGGIVMALVVPVSAHASTKVVYMGPAPKDEKALNNFGADANAYFPSGITVHAGDSVKFMPVNFHTVHFPKKGQKGPDPFAAPTGTKVADSNDAGGTAFWFNGQDNFAFNPVLFPPQFGKTVTYSAAKGVQSGPPVTNNPGPFTVKFTKPGTYTYFCDIHPGMKGSVHVVAKTAKAPSVKDDAKTIKKEVSKDLALAKKAATDTPPANTVDVGHAVGPVEYFGFLPGNLTVKAGTTVTFTMTQGSFETHSATFGPGDPEKDPSSYLGQISGSFQGPGPFDPRAVYPSDPPGSPASFTASSHGNGFWNSGLMDELAASPLPSSNAVRFDQPGTYDYYCMIHPFMHGTVTVTS
jgi:plastocyanin